MHRHPLRSGDAPQTQQPLKCPLPSTQKTPVANQPDRLLTTTNLPEKPPTHARPLHIYAIKTFSPHPCFLPSAHIPPLRPTHQCLSTHNALPTLPTKHARPPEFQPCQAKAPLDTPLNTKPKPALPIPLPKLPTPRQSLLSTAHAKNSC